MKSLHNQKTHPIKLSPDRMRFYIIEILLQTDKSSIIINK
ncbi:hypothetical protein U750_10350 [Streptococcus pseudopneumoniae G42]|nr:hypothetical protein U752_04310 [Streptococcus pseudopneumoniae 1321]ETE03743.1 hypothetical protein U750_10350 [Streptococcus pseudopneumoniae G42]ETE04945.1 hypothetical protein U751_07780 [Streptococcus pseudopneumoniae 22725]